jgi:hypothetical protein
LLLLASRVFLITWEGLKAVLTVDWWRANSAPNELAQWPASGWATRLAAKFTRSLTTLRW